MQIMKGTQILVLHCYHGPSTLGHRETVYLKLRAYTGKDTQVLWASPGQITPAYLFILLEINCIKSKNLSVYKCC